MKFKPLKLLSDNMKKKPLLLLKRSSHTITIVVMILREKLLSSSKKPKIWNRTKTSKDLKRTFWKKSSLLQEEQLMPWIIWNLLNPYRIISENWQSTNRLKKYLEIWTLLWITKPVKSKKLSLECLKMKDVPYKMKTDPFTKTPQTKMTRITSTNSPWNWNYSNIAW